MSEQALKVSWGPQPSAPDPLGKYPSCCRSCRSTVIIFINKSVFNFNFKNFKFRFALSSNEAPTAAVLDQMMSILFVLFQFKFFKPGLCSNHLCGTNQEHAHSALTANSILAWLHNNELNLRFQSCARNNSVKNHGL